MRRYHGPQVLVSFFIIACFGNLFRNAFAVKIKESQAEILLRILPDLSSYQSLSKNWNTSNECGKWKGIKCDSLGNVVQIYLTANDVEIDSTYNLTSNVECEDDVCSFGTILNDIVSLRALKLLVLNEVGLSGSLPTNIGNLINLEILDLSKNALEGNIPSSIGNLTLLKYMDLNSNRKNDPDTEVFLTSLNGSIPDEIGNLVSLQYLNLAVNNFEGNIPANIGKLSLLREMKLDNNMFTGLPSNLSALVNLEHLKLQRNQLSVLPTDIGALVNLNSLDVSDNNLTAIPSSIGNLVNLEELNLVGNRITSVEPFATLPNLLKLELQGNGFTGQLPDLSSLKKINHLNLGKNFINWEYTNGVPEYFANFTHLNYLDMSYNNIGSPFPTIFTKLKNLTSLLCIQCNLSGTIPPEIGNLELLDYLDLGSNNLTGPIPKDIGALTILMTLRLNSNQLNGTIPSTFQDLTSLTELQLQENRLSGSIKNCITPAANVVYLHSNKFSGRLPSNFGTTTEIWLQDNDLNNVIPSSIFTSDLTALDLSRNILRGSLPKDIGEASGLTTLRLSGCGLTGPIPEELNNLISLQILDLSNNAFTLLPSLNDLTEITELSLSTNVIYGIGKLPQSEKLQKLDLSVNQLELPKFPSLPSVYNKSLITLNFADNRIKGTFLLKYLRDYKSLQSVFLGNNELTGRVPNLNQTTAEFLSFSNNGFGSTTTQTVDKTKTIDLSGNPLCLKNGAFCNGTYSRDPTQFNATDFCSVKCDGGNSPNLYINKTKGDCLCSGYLNVTLTLQSTPLSFVSTSAIQSIREWLSTSSEVDINQVQILSAAILTFQSKMIVEIKIFGQTNKEPDTQIQLKLISKITDPTTILNVGSVQNLAFQYVQLYVIPPSPPPPPSAPLSVVVISRKSKPLEAWVIGIIVAFGLLLIVTIITLVFYILCNREKKDSTFAIRIKEHFVKSIPFMEIKLATDNFNEEQLLGKGGYGFVYKGIGPQGEEWAVKRAKTVSIKGLEEFESEIDIISKISHTNIVKLLGFCDQKNEQILVYEFMSLGSLRALIKGPKDNTEWVPLTFKQRVNIALGSAEGLRYMHMFAKPAIIHRDIKTDNILVDHSFTAKIADFGLSKDIQDGSLESALATRVAGTVGYIDPEYYTSFAVTAKSDVYSFGVVLFELITGKGALLTVDNLEDPELPLTVALSSWIQPYVNDITEVVDPNMDSYNKEAMDMFVKVAQVCTERCSKYRPSMDEVARRLAQVNQLILGLVDKSGSQRDEPAISPYMGNYQSSGSSSSRLHDPISETFRGR